MKTSAFAFLPFLFIFLLADTATSRKDAGEYWRIVMKEETMPEVIQGLLHQNTVIQSETKPDSNHHHLQELNHNCDEDEHLVTIEKMFVEDIEPRPSATAYNNDNVGAEEKKKISKDFEPRPSASTYNNDFEPRPSATAYNNGIVGAEQKKEFANNFEPRTSVRAYNKGNNGVEEKKEFANDFEPIIRI